MKRTLLITSLTVVALAGSTLAASAFERGDRGERGPKGPRIQFSELDSNGDGQLTTEEMQAHFAARFKAIDSNGDGNVSADELAAYSAAEQAKRHAERSARMIEKRDSNGDGVLSLEEMQPQGQDRMFSRLDRNDDGMISEEEFNAMKKRHGKRKWGHGGPRDGKPDSN